MAVFGAPISDGQDSRNAIDCAMELIQKINEQSSNGAIAHTRIGIGLHAGEVIAGNV
jgi:class 3 adenylate cyclase